MLMIPFPISDVEYSVFVVLLDENIARIKAYDPAEVNFARMPSALCGGRRLREVVIGYATLEEEAALMAPGADIPILLRNLSRGFRFRPEAGDHDGAYMGPKDKAHS